MTWAPIGAWLVACGTLVSSPLLFRDESAPDPIRWPFFLTGIVAIALDSRTRRPEFPLESDRTLWASLGAIGALAAPWSTWRLAFVLLAIAPFIPMRSRGLTFRGLRRAIHTVALMGLGLGLLQLVLPVFLARSHDLPVLHGLVAGVLRLAGIPADVGSTVVTVCAARSSAGLVASVERLALGPATCLLVGTVLAESVQGALPMAGRIATLLLTWSTFLIVRLVVLFGLHFDGQAASVFYEPWPQLLSFFPLSLLWSLSSGSHRVSDSYALAPAPQWRRIALPVVGWGLLVAALGSHDPGIPKPGRVLVNERNSDWEWTDEPLDTRSYGERTTYSYFCMFEFIRGHFAAVDRNYGLLSAQVLSEYDVLIVKTPTSPFEAEEVDAIVAFVRDGGGLWLIGDHTNVFGTASCLNPVARRFGMRFRWDAVDDLSMHEQQVFHPPRIGAHPVTAWMPDSLMATSCSLEIESGVEAAMLGDTLYSDDARFDTYNFFGDRVIDGAERFGWFVQGASARFGRGRVVAFADSTTLSNFSFFFPGKWEMTLSTLEWLNRRNGHAWYVALRPSFIALGALLVIASLRRAWSIGATASLAAASCGVLLGLHASDAILRWSYPLPDPSSDLAVVAFETQRSGVRFPIEHRTHEWDSDSLHTFAVWTQRIGLVPRVFPTLTECLRGDAVVVAWPKGIDAQECRQLLQFVEKGGKLLVLDDSLEEPTDSNSLLLPFGLSFGDPLRQPLLRLDGIAGYGSERTVLLPSARSVRGGEAFLATVDGQALGSVVDFGAGRVAAVGVGRSFSVDRLGMTDSVPDPTQLALAEIEYHLFREVLCVSPAASSGSSRDLGARNAR